jgi:Isocitrate lyase family
MSSDASSFPDKVPRGLRGLSNPNRNLLSTLSDKEQLQQEAMAVERWWSQSRWKHTKRIYSGEYLLTFWNHFALLLSLASSLYSDGCGEFAPFR